MLFSNEVKSVENLFDAFNEKYYEGKLPRPVITIASKGKYNAYGWFSVGKIWNNAETKEKYHEINICAEYVARPIEEVVGTLLHEMAHLYCSYNSIKDTSNNGIYHNNRFKKVAEDHGLIIDKGRYGWHVTSLNEETKAYIKELNVEGFKLFRNPEHNPEASMGSGTSGSESEGEQSAETPKKKKSSIKWVCPVCGNICRTTKVFKLICGECMEPMERAD